MATIFKESSTVELKERLNADFKKEIIAFANTDGGDIYVGVASDGRIVGVEDSEGEMERISSMIHDGIHPDLVPYTLVETVTVEGRELVHVAVSRGGRPPYHLTDKGLKPSGVYVRHGVTSVPASEERIREMLRDSEGIAYDLARSMNQELTFEYAERYFARRQVGFSAANQRTLRLVDADGFYTNAALLLSDQCEHSLKCALFDGKGKTAFQARKEFYGSLLEQLEEAYEYISLSNHLRADFEGLERIETYEYPPYAVREALLNAIIHRDYSYSGSTLVNIFSDRMEFVSLGGLVKGITLQDIRHGVSQPRNMSLANIFYRLRLVESYGTGIQRMMESYEGKSQPKFETGPASFVVSLPNLRANGVGEEKPALQVRESPASLGYDDSQSKIIALIEERGSITRAEVQELLHCSSFPARQHLRGLLEQGRIEAVGKARATRYVLADMQ